MSGDNPLLARRIIVHESYHQVRKLQSEFIQLKKVIVYLSKDNDMIGPFDIGLVETKDSIDRDAGIQPICLPPPEIHNDADMRDIVQFDDLDCKVHFFIINPKKIDGEFSLKLYI